MNRIICFIVFLLFTGCSRIKFVTIDNGQIVTDKGQTINIVGNPHLICYGNNGEVLVDGYFVRQNNDKSFTIDEFGKKYVIVKNPICQFGPDA